VIASQIAQELSELTATNRKGVEALYEAEVGIWLELNLFGQSGGSRVYTATGSVAERQAQAKLESAHAQV
jgi:hypothetical protein